IQERHHEARDRALDAVTALIGDLRRAKEAGASDEALAEARAAQRKCQFFLDFAEAENSSGFHAPQEAMRILASAIDTCRVGQLALRAGRAEAPAAGAAGAD